MAGWMDTWLDEQMNEWMDNQMDDCTILFLPVPTHPPAAGTGFPTLSFPTPSKSLPCSQMPNGAPNSISVWPVISIPAPPLLSLGKMLFWCLLIPPATSVGGWAPHPL